jgi:hypothetical protein
MSNRDGGGPNVVGEDDPEWKKAMQLRAVKMAKEIANQLSSGQKKGFAELAGANKGVWKAMEGVKGQLQDIMSGENVRMGNLVSKKEMTLAEAIAADRHRALFE